MKQSTLIIILLLVAAGIGFYLYRERQKAAKPASVTANVVTERGGVSITATGQVPVTAKSVGFTYA